MVLNAKGKVVFVDCSGISLIARGIVMDVLCMVIRSNSKYVLSAEMRLVSDMYGDTGVLWTMLG